MACQTAVWGESELQEKLGLGLSTDIESSFIVRLRAQRARQRAWLSNPFRVGGNKWVGFGAKPR
jgi:hypothetical protein